MSVDYQFRQPNVSLAAFPGLRHYNAAYRVAAGLSAGLLREPAWGALLAEQVQLVPQSLGQLTEEVCAQLHALLPSTKFRLHANVRVTSTFVLADLSTIDQHRPWLAAAVRLHRRLGAEAYTLHSGSRRFCDLKTMFEHLRWLQDVFECPVGVEGQYPTADDRWLLSSWEEYRLLLDSGLPYAVDLSHLNIVANSSGRYEHNLVRDLLASPKAIEIHLSTNDGTADQHWVCTTPPWWADLLAVANPQAVLFSEGNQRRPIAIAGARKQVLRRHSWPALEPFVQETINA